MTIMRKRNEERLVDVQFNVHKFTARQRPQDKSKVVIISCFSEFGCEVLGVMYCVPRLKERNPGCYFIVMGWYGRAYLYKHLVDEFWETKEEDQWLRDKALAFHHDSRNLSKIEKAVAQYGRVFNANDLGRIAVGNECMKCGHFWGQTEDVKLCPKCNQGSITKSLFADINYWKQRMVPIPRPGAEKLAKAKSMLGPNPVGVFARNRTTYGRNLQIEFYVKLLDLLEKMKYTPIWMGEKQSTYPCPVPHILDFSRSPEARDLELTLALVSQCRFTVQFWTASTRLAAVMGVPYLIFESPDQLFGAGQEGYRMSLCTLGPKKLALCHFLKVYNDHPGALHLVERCIREMENNNYGDIIGLVDEPEVVRHMRTEKIARLGGV